MSSAENLTSILTIVLIVMVLILLVLAVVYVMIMMKNKKKNKEKASENNNINNVKSESNSDAKKIAKEYTKESIFKFMDFDRIEDNMIIQKNGNRYLMVVECQGVNYDLMSEAEKISVEEGFLQFLNTLRHPIQIYIQTRTVNLNESIENYSKKVEDLGYELEKNKNAYLKKLQSGQYSKEELEKDFYEVTKQTNLYEYGKDIIANTEKMSLNKSVLNKKYYIIIPYYAQDLGNNSFDKEEIQNLAFSELYTKSQSIIRTLAACEVNGKIMTSNELTDLLYVAYNRDDAEVFSIDRAMRAGYDELYTTAADVLDKQMKILDEEIERKALAMVNEKVLQARSQKQQKVDQKQEQFEAFVKQRAETILKQNSSYIGNKTTEKALELMEEDTNKKSKKTKEKGGNEDEEQKAKTTRSRKRTTSK